MAYCIQLLIVMLATAINDKTRHKTASFFLFVAAMSMFLMSSLRVDIGTDYVNYIDLYRQLVSGLYEYNFHVEPGYYFVTILSQSLFDSPVAMFAIMSAITLAPCVYLARRCSSAFMVVVTFLCMMFLPSLSLVRQMAAISILLISSFYLIEGRRKASLLWVAIACTFHYSAIVFVAFIFLRNIKIGIFFGVAIVAVFWFVMNTMQLPQLILLSDIVQGTKYGVYATSMFNEETSIGSGFGVIVKLMPSCFVIVMAYMSDMHKNIFKEVGGRFIINANYFFILATILSLSVRIFNRVSDITLFIPVVSAYFMVKYIPNKNNKIIFSIAFISVCIVWYLATALKSYSYLGYGLGITPYQWML